jgi:drug/metabolite transporter (DMT)-like permease
MKFPLSGALFLLGYILFVGVGSFLQKFGMKGLTPYQINFLMAIGMLVTTIPALLIKQGNLAIPLKPLPLGIVIGLLMALGSISYVLSLSRIAVGTAAAISTSYVVVVAVLSAIFLDEKFGWQKIAGIVLALVGVAMISWKEN